MSTTVHWEISAAHARIVEALVQATKLVRLANGFPNRWEVGDRAFEASRVVQKLCEDLPVARKLFKTWSTLFRSAHEEMRMLPRAIYDATGMPRESAHEAALEYAERVFGTVWGTRGGQPRHLHRTAVDIDKFWDIARRDLAAENERDILRDTHRIMTQEVRAAARVYPQDDKPPDEFEPWQPISIAEIFNESTAAASADPENNMSPSPMPTLVIRCGNAANAIEAYALAIQDFNTPRSVRNEKYFQVQDTIAALGDHATITLHSLRKSEPGDNFADLISKARRDVQGIRGDAVLAAERLVDGSVENRARAVEPNRLQLMEELRQTIELLETLPSVEMLMEQNADGTKTYRAVLHGDAFDGGDAAEIWELNLEPLLRRINQVEVFFGLLGHEPSPVRAQIGQPFTSDFGYIEVTDIDTGDVNKCVILVHCADGDIAQVPRLEEHRRILTLLRSIEEHVQSDAFENECRPRRCTVLPVLGWIGGDADGATTPMAASGSGRVDPTECKVESEPPRYYFRCNRSRGTVLVNGRVVKLSEGAMRNIAMVLVENRGNTVSYAAISEAMGRIIHPDSQVDTAEEDVRPIISRINSAFREAGGPPRAIENDRGCGYRIPRPKTPKNRGIIGV